MTKIYRKIPPDLIIISIYIVITFIFITVPILENSIVRTILGIPMVLFIPGYLFVTALFTKKNDLDIIERITLSFGLSIAIISLLGLLFNFTFGIRLIPILTAICIYDIILICIAIYRRRELSEDIFSTKFDRKLKIVDDNIPKNKIDTLTIIFIFTIFLTIGMIIYVITIPKIGEKFTEFYILGPYGNTDNYPTELKLNSSATLLTGIVNREYATVNYTIHINLNGDMLFSEKLILGHNRSWEKNITFVPDKKGNDEKLELLLFKENNFTGPYRELHLWMNVTS